MNYQDVDAFEDFMNNTYIPVGIILKVAEKAGLSQMQCMDHFHELLIEIEQSDAVLRCVRRTSLGPTLSDNIIKMAKFVRDDDGRFGYYVYKDEEQEDESIMH